MENIIEIWRVLRLLTGFQGVSVTIPRRSLRSSGKYQIRCWGEKIGMFEGDGHVDGYDLALFEIMADNAPSEHYDMLYSYFRHYGMDGHMYNWKRQVITSRRGEKCDVFTLVPV